MVGPTLQLRQLHGVPVPERLSGESTVCEVAADYSHARIRLHDGKTRIWNAAGEEPVGIAGLQPASADAVCLGWLLVSSSQAGWRSRQLTTRIVKVE